VARRCSEAAVSLPEPWAVGEWWVQGRCVSSAKDFKRIWGLRGGGRRSDEVAEAGEVKSGVEGVA